MKKFNSLKAMFTYMVAAFVGMVVVSACSKDDITGHDDANQSKGKIVVKEDTTKKPEPVLTDTIYGKIVNDSLIIVHDSLRNDTIFKTEKISLGFNAKISREFDERKTTVERLAKLDFSYEEAQNKQDGKMQYFSTQKSNDMDAQNYTTSLNSGKGSLASIKDAHFELISTTNTNVKNVDIEKKSTDSIRVKSTMDWEIAYRVVNVPNLEGKEFKTSINQTNHERFISYGDAVLVSRDTTMTPTYGIWSTEWLLKVKETYRVNGKDSIYEPTPKKVTLVSKCGIDPLEDAFVGSLDFNHSFNSEKWSNWYDVESNDKSVAIQERRFERLGVSTNGIEKDKFNTKSYVTEQKATVVFAGLTWNIPATNATLTNVRHTFLDNEASDIDGYSMIKFVDDEIATYNNETNENEPNYKKLNSSCKLYLKVATPEVEKYLFDQTVVRTVKDVTVTTIVTPVLDNGNKLDTIHCVLNLPETFKCLDNVSFEKVAEISEVTGKLTEDGEVSKTKESKTVNGGKYTYNKYEQKYTESVTSNGQTQYHHWVSTWYDDFEFSYDGKANTNEYTKVKSYSASCENEAEHLTKSTSLSTEELEVYLYSMNGSFVIDGITRTDVAPGTFTKVVIGTNHWDESTKGQEHTAIYSKRWCKYIRYKADGTVTEQLYEAVFNNLTGGSEHRVTAEQPVYTSGTVVPLAPSSEARTDDFCSFDAIKYSFEKDAFYQGAAESMKDFSNFTVSENAYFEVEGNRVYFENPEHSISHTDSELKKVSETDEVTTYERQTDWTFTFGGAQMTATSKGIVDIIKSQDTPDFNYSIEGVIESIACCWNRIANPLTAYTGVILLSENKCQPYGIYVDGRGEVTFKLGNIQDRFTGMNGAAFLKDKVEVVATKCVSADGFLTWYDQNNKVIDACLHIDLQGVDYNDSGNVVENKTGKYKPVMEVKNGVQVVTWSGISEDIARYTYKK